MHDDRQPKRSSALLPCALHVVLAAVLAICCGGLGRDPMDDSLGGSGGTVLDNADSGVGETPPDAEDANSRLCYGGCDGETQLQRPLPLPRPRCPSTEPQGGASCQETGLLCGYGGSSSAECRRYFECRGTWTAPEPLASRLGPPCQLEQEECPNEIPHETACILTEYGRAEPPCQYGGLTCWCQPAGLGEPGERGQWACYGPPEDPRCPAALPNPGEGCDTQGVACNYVPNGCYTHPYASAFCFRNEWEAIPSTQDCGG